MSEPKTVSLPLEKAPSLKGGNDAAAAKHLLKLFSDAQKGMRLITAVGIAAWEIKETQLKHNEWGPWLAQHAPALCRVDSKTSKPKASSALTSYMSMTRNVLKACGFTLEKYFEQVAKFPHAGICHGGKYLLLPDKKVPEDLKPLREKICSLVDGKTKRQLDLDFNQMEEDPDTGEQKKKRGQLKGSKGCTKEDRAAAKQREREAEVLELKLRLKELGKELDDLADDTKAGDPELADDLNKLFPHVENFFRYLQSMREARKGK